MPEDGTAICGDCDGTGSVTVVRRQPDGLRESIQQCPACAGRGRFD